MSGGNKMDEIAIHISLDADQKIEDIKDELGEEILDEAVKIAKKRESDTNSRKVTVKPEDIDEAWKIVKNRKQGSKCYNFLSCELPPHKCGGFLLQRRATQRH